MDKEIIVLYCAYAQNRKDRIMPRPRKFRKVGYIPKTNFFIPDTSDKGKLEEVIVSIEEIEALRLYDYEGYDQDVSAASMNISRGTFQRILNSARYKITDALINGKSIRIEGGNYTRNLCRLI